MAHETLRFEFVDGTAELVRHGSVRYWELIEDGHTPVGSIPASDGISDPLEAYLAARFSAAAAEATAGLEPRVSDVEAEVEGRLSESGLAATIEAGVEPVRPDNGARAVGQGELVINVKDYGAVGDGTTDDAAAIQSAVTASYAAKAEVFFPAGTYRIDTSIKLPRAIRMRGVNAVGDAYSAATKATVIHSYASATFEQSTHTSIHVMLSGILFENKHATPDNGVLMKGFSLDGSQVTNITALGYGVIFEGPSGGGLGTYSLHSVSIVRGCFFEGLRVQFNRGAVVDSVIEGNYINGKPESNATCFEMVGWAMTTIANNYIDYFKHMFRLTGTNNTVTVVGNKLDIAYRVLSSPTATPRSVDRMTFTGNIIRYVREADMATYFPSRDTEMTTGPWAAFDLYGVTHATWTGNVFDKVATAFRLRGYPNTGIRIIGNTYSTVTTKVDYSIAKSGVAGDLTDIYIEPMEGPTATLPSAALTGASVVSYPNHKVTHASVPVFNDAGTWKKYDGTTYVP